MVDQSGALALKDRDSIQYFTKRIGAMRSERASFISHYQDLSQFVQPRRGRFTTTDRNKGGSRHSAIINSRATQAHRIARAGMFAGTMNPARPWFKFGVLDDPDLEKFQPVKEWLHDTELLMREVFNRSNLYNMAPVLLGELLLFATGFMTHVFDFKDVARFYTHTAGSYMIGQNDRFEVTTSAREFEMTVNQMVSAFGYNKVSITIKNQYDLGNYDNWAKVNHFIEPNPNADPSRAGSQFKPFRSIMFEPGSAQGSDTDKDFLSKKGFNRFPGYAPRWDVTGEDIYGTDCPAMTALGDITGLQIQEKRKAQGIDKQVNPPLHGPAQLLNKPVSSLPGGLVVYDMVAGGGKLEPIYNVQINLNDMTTDIQRVERRIEEAFYVDMFLAITNMQGIQPKNELELMQRNEERLLQLGPPLGRIHGEFLEGLIDRTFDQMVEVDMLPPAPKELQGMQLKVLYISSLAMAQRAVATGSIDRFTLYVKSLAEMGYENVLDKMNADEAADTYGSIIGVPPKLIVADEVVAEVRREREVERQRQEQQQLIMAAAETAGKVAKDGASAFAEVSGVGLGGGGGQAS